MGNNRDGCFLSREKLVHCNKAIEVDERRARSARRAGIIHPTGRRSLLRGARRVRIARTPDSGDHLAAGFRCDSGGDCWKRKTIALQHSYVFRNEIFRVAIEGIGRFAFISSRRVDRGEKRAVGGCDVLRSIPTEAGSLPPHPSSPVRAILVPSMRHWTNVHGIALFDATTARRARAFVS